MLHFHLSTTPISSKIRFIIEGLTRLSRIFLLQATGILIWSQWKNYEGAEDS